MPQSASSFEKPARILNPLENVTEVYGQPISGDAVDRELEFDETETEFKKPNNLKKIIVAVLAASALLGGGAYYYRDYQVKKAVAEKIAQEQAVAKVAAIHAAELEKIKLHNEKVAAQKLLETQKAEAEATEAKRKADEEAAAALKLNSKSKQKAVGPMLAKTPPVAQTRSVKASQEPVAQRPARPASKLWFTVNPS